MNFKASEYLIPIFDFDVLHMQLNTPIFIFILVIAVMFFMNKLLFKPVLSTLDKRTTYLQGLEKTASRQREEIGKLTGQYEERMEKAQAEVAQMRAEAHKEALEEVKAILNKAQREADGELQEALEVLNKEVEQAKQELGRMAKELAEKTADRILN